VAIRASESLGVFFTEAARSVKHATSIIELFIRGGVVAIGLAFSIKATLIAVYDTWYSHIALYSFKFYCPFWYFNPV
jgi:hypothetical protein